MKNYREIIFSILRRLIPAAAILTLGWYMLATASGGWSSVPQLLVGLSLFVLAAIIIAGPLARLISEPTGNLFYSGERFDRPQPIYSIPRAERAKGHYEEAMAGYEKIAQDYPPDPAPYIEMIDIAFRDLQVPSRALKVYETGMSRLTKEDDRAVLTQMYMAIRSRDTK